MDERELVTRSQKGELTAFNQLVLHYQAQLYNLCLRMLGAKEAAEDATQEAFLSAYRSLKQFRGGSFRSWLLRIASNICYDQLRSSSRRRTTSLEDLVLDPEESFDVPDPGEQPEDVTLRAELGNAIRDGLDTLPAEQRLVVILSDIQGLSYEEIAEVTSSNLGTVKSRLSRGRLHLRDHLLQQQELLPQRFRQ